MMELTAGKVISCKAAVTWRPGSLDLETVNVAPPTANEVRVKIVATGVCHTDAHFIWRECPSERYPLVTGHEGAGIIESVGDGVTAFKPGDHVLTHFLCECGSCRTCKHPKSNICVDSFMALAWRGFQRDGTTRITHRDGREIKQLAANGSFAQYAVLSEILVTKVNPSAPLEKVCLLACGVPTGYGAAINTAAVEPGWTCAVWGLGTIGLAAVLGCKTAGATKIIGVDLNSGKEEIGRKMGCTDFINPKDHSKPVHELIKEMTGGIGCDAALECIGIPSVVETALKSIRDCGRCVVVGVPPDDGVINVPASNLLFSGKRLEGTLYGGYKPSEIASLVDDYLKGKLDLEPFITHNLPLDKINEGFELLREGKSIRTVIHMAEE